MKDLQIPHEIFTIHKEVLKRNFHTHKKQNTLNEFPEMNYALLLSIFPSHDFACKKAA